MKRIGSSERSVSRTTLNRARIRSITAFPMPPGRYGILLSAKVCRFSSVEHAAESISSGILDNTNYTFDEDCKMRQAGNSILINNVYKVCMTLL